MNFFFKKKGVVLRTREKEHLKGDLLMERNESVSSGSNQICCLDTQKIWSL